jgi:hypothetical protein
MDYIDGEDLTPRITSGALPITNGDLHAVLMSYEKRIRDLEEEVRVIRQSKKDKLLAALYGWKFPD